MQFSKPRKISFSPKTLLLRNISNYFLKKQNKRFSKIRDYRFAVFAHDFIGLQIFLDGHFENEELNDLFYILSRIDINIEESAAIDIGSNIGNHTIYFSRLFKKVLSFEPNQITYKLLLLNCSPYNNIETFNFGLSDKTEITKLSEDASNSGSSSIFFTHDFDSTLDVNLYPLDELKIDLDNLKLIKIDVEGMEYNVLKGAKKMLVEHRPVVVFEQQISDFQSQYAETKSIDFIRKLNYEIIVPISSYSHNKSIIARLRFLLSLLFSKDIHYIHSFNILTNVEKGKYAMLYAIPKEYLDKLAT